MKSWCDLSWREKCKITNGEVNKFNYLSGYDFRVKTKVREGVERKNGEDSFTTTATKCGDLW